MSGRIGRTKRLNPGKATPVYDGSAQGGYTLAPAGYEPYRNLAPLDKQRTCREWYDETKPTAHYYKAAWDPKLGVWHVYGNLGMGMWVQLMALIGPVTMTCRELWEETNRKSVGH